MYIHVAIITIDVILHVLTFHLPLNLPRTVIIEVYINNYLFANSIGFDSETIYNCSVLASNKHISMSILVTSSNGKIIILIVF